MGKIVLYHGSTVLIEHPLANVGREDLDFGKGFYLTTIVEQALGQLIYAKPNHQICLLNQSIIDRYLHFVESYVVNV